MRLIDADDLKSPAVMTSCGETYGCSFDVIDRQPTIEPDRDNIDNRAR